MTARNLTTVASHLRPPGWAVGIAESRDLVAWTKIGELLPAQMVDAKGVAAPEAIVLKGRLHLFYQTYGNRANDAICHAVLDDGLTFIRDDSNPVSLWSHRPCLSGVTDLAEGGWVDWETSSAMAWGSVFRRAAAEVCERRAGGTRADSGRGRSARNS